MHIVRRFLVALPVALIFAAPSLPGDGVRLRLTPVSHTPQVAPQVAPQIAPAPQVAPQIAPAPQVAPQIAPQVAPTVAPHVG